MDDSRPRGNAREKSNLPMYVQPTPLICWQLKSMRKAASQAFSNLALSEGEYERGGRPGKEAGVNVLSIAIAITQVPAEIGKGFFGNVIYQRAIYQLYISSACSSTVV